MGAGQNLLVMAAVATVVLSVLLALVGLPRATGADGGRGLEPIPSAFVPAFAGGLVVFGAQASRHRFAWVGAFGVLAYGVFSLVPVGIVYLAYGALMSALLWREGRQRLHAGPIKAAPRPHARA